jgi:Icc-related predicted phosphoesterase
MQKPMKIIYVADIHGAFDRVGQLLDATDADIYIVAGDLIDLPFYTMNTAMHYHDLQTYFHSLRRKMNHTNELLEDFVDNLLLTPDLSEEIQEKGAKFQQYTIRARRVMQQKYKVLENILSLKAGARCFCLPGNYDMDLRYTSLHHRDLHLQRRVADGLVFGGYGGAGGWTQGIPERYVIHGSSGCTVSEQDRQMLEFFKEARPDIVVAHQPAHGFHDQVAPMGETGSPALLNYCQNHDVLACLTGHIHEQWGLAENEGTLYLNPSNFGDVSLISGRISEGGFFHEIELASKRIDRVFYRKMMNGAVYDILAYEHREGAWQISVIDRERYGAHLRGQLFDLPTDKASSQAPEWLGEAKAIYRRHPDEISYNFAQEILRGPECGRDLPFSLDMIGSANDGSKDTISDMEFVLYMRCGRSDSEKKCFSGSLSECPCLKAARAVIRERIGERFAFEIIDCIDLDHVEKSIRLRNYECEMIQRFVVYRSVGRLIGASHLRETEALLRQDAEFIHELGGSIRSYLRIFLTAAGHVRSLSIYESHLQSIGIRLPGSIRTRIRAYLETRQAK